MPDKRVTFELAIKHGKRSKELAEAIAEAAAPCIPSCVITETWTFFVEGDRINNVRGLLYSAFDLLTFTEKEEPQNDRNEENRKPDRESGGDAEAFPAD